MGSASPVKWDGPFMISTTVDDLSYTPSGENTSLDTIQISETGRRSWKTLRGRGEVVWPPLLEAALLEALEKYSTEVMGYKSEKRFGRFPMRNRFISDYIYEMTGKRRTPKQVGSRLQQLRDTCKEERILRLISPRNVGDAGSSSQSESSLGTPVLLLPPPEFVSENTYVKILLQDDLRPAPPPTIQLANTLNANLQSIQLSPIPNPPSGTTSQNKSNILSYFSGAIEISSSFALLPQSTFVVYAEGSTSPIHSGVASLRCISSPMQRSGLLYSFDLAPSFWESLCASRDITRYMIIQTLKPAHPNPSDDFGKANCIMSVAYWFEASESRPQEIPPMPDTSTTLAPDSTPPVSYDYSKETNHRCTGSTNTMIQGSGINIQGGEFTNVGGDYHNHTYVVKESTKGSKLLKALQDTITRLENFFVSKEDSSKDDNNEEAAPSRRLQGEVDRTSTAAELTQDEVIEHTTSRCKPYQSVRVVGPTNLGTRTFMGDIDGALRRVGKDFETVLSTSQHHDPKKSTKTVSNGDQAIPSRRSRVETEGDPDDDELDTIANAPYDQPTEIKFSSLDDPPSTPASESGTTLDDEYCIYQTPPPIKRQLLVFVPGILQYVPCWFWLPSLTGLGQWVASWTATWVTPPCWMPSLI